MQVPGLRRWAEKRRAVTYRQPPPIPILPTRLHGGVMILRARVYTYAREKEMAIFIFLHAPSCLLLMVQGGWQGTGKIRPVRPRTFLPGFTVRITRWFQASTRANNGG